MTIRMPDLRDWPADPEEQYLQKQRRYNRATQYPASTGGLRPTRAPRKGKRMAVVPKPDNDMFRPSVRLDPSMVTDRRGVVDLDKIIFWVGQWWNEPRPPLRTPRTPPRKRAPNKVPAPGQRYNDEANQPSRIALPIQRATPQPRRR